MDKPQYATLTYPTFGLDLSAAFSGQRPQTTALAVNVRLYEPSQERARGGSRPGLRRFVNQQLPLV